MWGKKNLGRGLTEDRGKNDENSMIQTSTAPTEELVKIEDIGKTADLLEIARPSSAAVFLSWTHSKGDTGQPQFGSAVITEKLTQKYPVSFIFFLSPIDEKN
jgi:hypothetical protein